MSIEWIIIPTNELMVLEYPVSIDSNDFYIKAIIESHIDKYKEVWISLADN
jgi:hypothetical protein